MVAQAGPKHSRSCTNFHLSQAPMTLIIFSGVERQHEAKPLRVKSTQAEPLTIIMAILPRRLPSLRIQF